MKRWKAMNEDEVKSFAESAVVAGFVMVFVVLFVLVWFGFYIVGIYAVLWVLAELGVVEVTRNMLKVCLIIGMMLLVLINFVPED